MDMSDIKPYKRQCSNCGKDIFHTNIKNRNHADRIKKLCRSCGVKLNHADFSGNKNPFFGKKHTDEVKKNIKNMDRSFMSGKNHYSITKPGWRETMRNNILGNKNPMYGKRGKLNPFFGKKHKIETILSLKEKCSGKNAGNYGKKFSDEHKLKIRMSHIERIKGMGFHYKANFNPKACKYFDNINNERGWNLQHALNGGEQNILGYWLDAYDKEKNVVIEYDESYHYDKNGNLKNKDIKRMNRVINHLKCTFYRFNSITNTLQEYHLPTSDKNFLLASS